METISHLLRPLRSLARVPGIETTTIPADHFNAVMLSQPLTGGSGRLVRQHVEDLAP